MIQYFAIDSDFSSSGTRVGMAWFSSDVTTAFDLNTYDNKADLTCGILEVRVV